MLKYINSWTLKKWQANFLYFILSVLYPKKIQKGDTIKCHGIGYPHWKGETFICDVVFDNDTIGIKKAVRVSSKDFRVI